MLVVVYFLLQILFTAYGQNCNARQCAFVARHGMTMEEATNELELRRSQTYTLRTFDGYHNGEESLFAGLWEKCSNERYKHYVVLSLSREELDIELIQRKFNGYCLNFINAYNTPNGAQRYIAMWTFNNGNCDIIEVVNDINGDQYQEIFDFLTARDYSVFWLSGNADENFVRR